MFRLIKDNRNWFKGISKNFSTLFDMYYLCLMMGLAANHKGDDPDSGDLIEYWPTEYASYSNFIIGLILIAEARGKGINIKEKSSTTEHLNTFLDSEELSRLSLKKGFKEANRYANGGCEIMRQKLEPPHYLGEFLKRYQELLKEEVNKNENFI
jgi:hypothetical protein|tara:strand:+ start:23 stop:484 length:462 start_codon:yes stop_codon:yes gene_type:complete